MAESLVSELRAGVRHAAADDRIFDDLLQTLRSARLDLREVKAFLRKTASLFDGYADLTIFDGSGKNLVFGLSVPELPSWRPGAIAPDCDPSYYSKHFAALVQRTLDKPSDLRELVPPKVMERDPWFKGLCRNRGIDHVLLQDLQRDGRRARFSVMRLRERGEFTEAEKDLFGRIGRLAAFALSDVAVIKLASPQFAKDALIVRYANQAGDLATTSLAWQLRNAFGLTPSEARVALLLASGRSPEESASAMDNGISTTRSYIKRVHSKLGVHRLGELIWLISSLPGWKEFVEEHTVYRNN